MPRSRRRKGKRTKGSRGVSSATPAKLETQGGSIPPNRRVKLRFAVSSNTATSGTLANTLVSINNLFDPGVSLSAAQPVYFDQLALMYNRYRCYGCGIKIVGVIQADAASIGSTQQAARLCVSPINGTLAPTTFEDACAQSGAKFGEITGAKPCYIRHHVTCAALSGQRDITGSDRFQAIVSAAPSETLNWSISYISSVAFTNQGLHLEIELEFDVEFFDRINLDRSSLSYFHLRKALVAHYQEVRAAELDRLKRRELQPLPEVPEFVERKVMMEQKDSRPESPVLISVPAKLPVNDTDADFKKLMTISASAKSPGLERKTPTASGLSLLRR